MSKKSKKLNLAELSTRGLELLNGYSVAAVSLKRLAAEQAAEEKPLTAEREELRKELIADGTTAARRAEIGTRLFGISKELTAIAAEYGEEKKPHRRAQSAALALVPEEVYRGYVTAWESGADALWTVCIRDFVRRIGIGVEDDVKVANFAATMKFRVSGSRKATKKDESGRTLAAKSARTFDRAVMDAFIDYAVVDKGVLDRAADGSLSRHVFEGQTA